MLSRALHFSKPFFIGSDPDPDFVESECGFSGMSDPDQIFVA